MNLDLYKIYRLVSQRARRDTQPLCGTLSARMKSVFRDLLENPSVEGAEAFISIETEWSKKRGGSPSLYGPSVLSSIIQGTYDIKRPTNIKNFNVGDDPKEGFVYMAASNLRPGELKIGYTTLEPKQRVKKYQQKYGYKLDLLYSRQSSYPARVEKEIHELFAKKRVSAQTFSDSNEWFMVGEEECKAAIDRAADDRSLTNVIPKDEALRFFCKEALGTSISHNEINPQVLSELECVIEDILGSILPAEANVAAKFFGFPDGDVKTISMISAEINIGPEKVRKNLESAILKIRHPSRSKRLRDLLESLGSEGDLR